MYIKFNPFLAASPLKSVQIRTFFWFVSSRIRTEYGDLRSKREELNLRIRSDCGKIRTRRKLRIWTLFSGEAFKLHLKQMGVKIDEHILKVHFCSAFFKRNLTFFVMYF